MALDTMTLQCFLSVAETGNITKTGEYIGRTQSAVSQQINRLEQLLGKTLFNRDNHLTLTYDGEIFHGYALKIYQLQRESIDRLNCFDIEGEIKIGLPEDFASKLLTEVLTHFSQMHPLVNLNIECDLTSNILGRFNQNEFDLCIIKTLQRDGIPDDALICQDELVWIGSTEMQKRLKKEPIIPLILSPQTSIYRNLAIQKLEEAGVKWRVVLSSRSYASKIIAVQAGLGITVMQKSFIPRESGLLSIKQLPKLGLVNLYILKHKNGQVIDYLVKLLMKLMTGTI